MAAVVITYTAAGTEHCAGCENIWYTSNQCMTLCELIAWSRASFGSTISGRTTVGRDAGRNGYISQPLAPFGTARHQRHHSAPDVDEATQYSEDILQLYRWRLTGNDESEPFTNADITALRRRHYPRIALPEQRLTSRSRANPRLSPRAATRGNVIYSLDELEQCIRSGQGALSRYVCSYQRDAGAEL